MIKQKTARAMLYDWHDGDQRSATYAAASSGLIQNFEELLQEVRHIGQPDRDKLTEYLLRQQSKGRYVCKGSTANPADYYLALPWAD